MRAMKARLLNNILHWPNWVNHILLSLNKFPLVIYGKRYADYRAKLDRERYLDYDNSQQLLDVVNFAIKNVPYYSSLYNSGINSIGEFKTLGFVDKDIVMHSLDSFFAENVNYKDYDRGTTGGTSGKPLQLLLPKNRYVVELATVHSMWENVGFNHHSRAVIRNHKLKEDQVYTINPITKEFIFDSFRLNDKYMHEIYLIIKKFNIQYIHAYPSAAYQFSTFLYNNHLDCSFIKAFLSGSENILQYQKRFIEEKLAIKFYNWYGHSEKVVLGGYCESTDFYHIEPTYGYFELIDRDGNNVSTPGVTGEIVGSTLHNYGMPLIRYRTGDFAEYVADQCPNCGRKLPIIKDIKGRWSGEKIYNYDGTYVTTTALNLHNSLYSVINGLQYIQQRKGELTISIIKSNLFTSVHDQLLYDHFRSKLNKDAKIEIKFVASLHLQKNGKFLQLISRIDQRPENEGSITE